MLYVGRHSAKADEKGRLFLPAVFRQRSSDGESSMSYVLKKDLYAPCLVLYPALTWNDTLTQLKSRLNRWNPDHAMLFRKFMSDIECINHEANGRFLLPKRFQWIIGQDRRVEFLGVDDRIEIWNSNIASQMLEEQTDWTDKLKQLME